MLGRFAGRADDPAQRPAGALPIEYLVLSYPLLDLAGLPLPPESPESPESPPAPAPDGADAAP